MGSYTYGKQAVASKDQSRIRTWWKVGIITVLLMIPFGVYIVLTTLPPNPVTGKTIDKGSFDPFTTVKTNWFSFRVEKTWQSVPELTTEDHVYTYREMQGANPQGLLRIYINQQPSGADGAFSRVVPVSVKDGHTFMAKDMLPDCTDQSKDKRLASYEVTQGEVSFNCWPGTSLLYAVAGEEGGDSSITMTRADGTTANYIITYRNLAFSPNDSTLTRILGSFKSL